MAVDIRRVLRNIHSYIRANLDHFLWNSWWCICSDRTFFTHIFIFSSSMYKFVPQAARVGSDEYVWFMLVCRRFLLFSGGHTAADFTLLLGCRGSMKSPKCKQWLAYPSCKEIRPGGSTWELDGGNLQMQTTLKQGKFLSSLSLATHSSLSEELTLKLILNLWDEFEWLVRFIFERVSQTIESWTVQSF